MQRGKDSDGEPDVDELIAQEEAAEHDDADYEEMIEEPPRQRQKTEGSPRSFGNVPLAQQSAAAAAAGSSSQPIILSSSAYSSPPRSLETQHTNAAAAAPPEAESAPLDMPLDPLQQAAVDAAISGKNIFLTGGPGTGKSFTTKKMIKLLRQKHLDFFRRVQGIENEGTLASLAEDVGGSWRTAATQATAVTLQAAT